MRVEGILINGHQHHIYKYMFTEESSFVNAHSSSPSIYYLDSFVHADIESPRAN